MSYSLKYIIRKDRENNKGTSPMYLRYIISRKFKDVPVGVSVEKSYWDDENSYIKRKYPNYDSITKLMFEFQTKIEYKLNEYYSEFGRYPHTKELLPLLSDKIKFDKRTETNPISLEILFEEFKKNRLKLNYKETTFKIYNQFWIKWCDFEKETYKRSLKELDEKTIIEFRTYLINKKLQSNTIGKQIKTLKTFFNFISKHHKNLIPQDFRDFKVDKEDTDFIVLNELEIEKLSSYVLYSPLINNDTKEDIVLSKRQRLIGRIFLFLCSTGLSFVDFSRLTIDNIFITENKSFKTKFVNIKITRQKINSKIDCIIPIIGKTIDLVFVMLGSVYYNKDYDKSNPFVESIDKISSLESSINWIKKDFPKNKIYRIFPYVSSQKFNKEIKEVLKIIGIDDRVKINKIIKNRKKEEYKPKYELVSSHTGRRTYITWCVLKGIEKSTIMKTTGHKILQTLHKYNKTDEESVNEEFYRKIKNNNEQLVEKVKKIKTNKEN
jgi:site-specific recombinase XerD